jgi:hypothetical protein
VEHATVALDVVHLVVVGLATIVYSDNEAVATMIEIVGNMIQTF